MYEKTPSWHGKALILIGIAFLCVHGGLFLFDLAHPDAFLHGDRAANRIRTITELLSAYRDELPNLILNSTSGVPGDFIQHALLYWAGGPYLVIACQIALELLTVIITYIGVARLTGNATVAAAAGLFLIVMPGMLMNPHLLTSEVWFTAFLTAGVLLICLSANPDTQTILARYFYPGFVCLALACSVRTQGLLVPLAIGICLYVSMPQCRGRVVAGGLLSYLVFPVAWMTLRFLTVGDFSMGLADTSLENNFAIRGDRLLSLPTATHEKMTLLEFLAIVASHPLAAWNSYFSDAVNLILNPGINHVISYYLGLFPVTFEYSAEGKYFRDEFGFLGTVLELFRQNKAYLALFATWTVIHLTILFSIAMVAFRATRHAMDGKRGQMWVHISLVVIVLVLACSFASGAVRWGHRAGIEPLMALLAAYGLFGGGAYVFRAARAPALVSEG